MDPEAQDLQRARDIGEQASVAVDLYGAATPFAAASTLARQGQIMGVNPLNVFHGSPYRFTKLDSSKIGTGEGAQTYGYGLYFSENPAVAKGYRDRLSRSQNPLTVNDKGKFSDLITKEFGNNKIIIAGIEYPTSKQIVDGIKGGLIKRGNISDELYDYASQFLPKTGGFYTIDLPDQIIDRMLDWDKPLRNQSDYVKKALFSDIDEAIRTTKEALERASPRTIDLFKEDLKKLTSRRKQMEYMSASAYYKDSNFNRTGKPQDASNQLRQIGIPGIKYFDQGSRNAGAGTRNFVVFPGEEEAMTILSRE
jgi:hypothetical protein